MKEYRYLFIRLSIYLVAGIILAFWFSLERKILLLCLLLFLLSYILVFIRARKQIFQDKIIGVFSLFMILLLGYTSTYFSIPENQTSHYIHVTDTTEYILKAEIVEELKPTKFGDRYILNTERLFNNNSERNIQGKILLTIQKDSVFKKVFMPGDLVLLPWQPIRLAEPLNPYQFNYKKYLQHLQIEQQISLQNDQLKVVGQCNTPFSYAKRLRIALIDNLQEYNFGKDELAVFQALVLGEKRGISTNLYQNYAAAGAIHILAISGLHIGILLLFLNFLFKPLESKGIARFLKPGIIIILLWMFALLTGFNPSVVRAVCMFSFIAVGMHLKRKTSVLNSLFLSLFCLLLINPYYLFQVGFQLSYLAVFSIVTIQPYIYRLMDVRFKLADYFWKLISVSLAAQIGVLPLSIYYFHQFPGMFLLSNMVILPFLGILLGLGIFIIILSSTQLLPGFLVELYNFLLQQMNALIEKISSFDNFIVSEIPFSSFQLFTCYLMLIASIFLLKKINFRRLQFLLITLILFQASTIYAKAIIPKHESIIFNISRETVLAEKEDKILKFYTDSIPNVKDYVRERRISKIKKAQIPNHLLLEDQLLMIVDTARLYSKLEITPDLLLLRNSPRLNFERFLDSVQPKRIIVDASNYPSFVHLWKMTAEQKKIPFHYTSEKGSYIISNKN